MFSPTELRNTADAIEAAKRGDPVQFFEDGQWQPCLCTNPNDWYSTRIYRPAPKPKTRPWKCASDVPLNCWLISPHNPSLRAFVVSVSNSGLETFSGGMLKYYSWSDWAERSENAKWTTDGVTLHPCTIKVSE